MWNGEIDWQVQIVFDPDGEGADFAYTMGAARHGVPEIHVWARPPDGDDVGEDWVLSPHDRMSLLNHVTSLRLRGELAAGDTWEEQFDGGLATVSFHLRGPVTAADVDAFALDPDDPVLELRWSLSRAQEPSDPVPYDPAWLDEVRALHRQVEAAGPTRERLWRTGPVRPALPTEPDPVMAFVALMRQELVHEGTTASLVAAIAVDKDLGRALAMIEAAARASGRRALLDQVRALAEEDADVIARICHEDDDQWNRAVRNFMVSLFTTGYGTAVTGDHLDPEARTQAWGWLLAVLDPDRAHDRFDGAVRDTEAALLAAKPEAWDEVVLPASDIVNQALSYSARAATAGVGAPLMGRPDHVYIRLFLAGFGPPNHPW